MPIDRIVLISAWIAAILLVLLTVPKEMTREAMLIFLFKQVLTWIFGLLVVEYHMIEYPVREFPIATATSFSFEYFIYPAVCIVYNIRFPVNKSLLYKCCWHIFFPTWMTILEVLIERYTDLITYKQWKWYWTWITLFMAFSISRVYFIWFIKKSLKKSPYPDPSA